MIVRFFDRLERGSEWRRPFTNFFQELTDMTIYRYRFRSEVPSHEVEASLFLAIIAVEGLHGEAQARLEARIALGGPQGSCVIDGRTQVGRDLAKVFTAFLRREFGEDSFRVEHFQPEECQGVAA